MSRFTLDIESLAQLGMWTLATDGGCTVVWASDRITKWLGHPLVGERSDRYLAPVDESRTAASLLRNDGRVLPLRGRWLDSADGGIQVFVGTPAPSTVSQMTELGITLDDFEVADPWLNHLILVDEHTALRRDSQKRIEQLHQERSDLRGARDAMRAAQRAALNMLSDVADAKRQADRAHGELQAAHRAKQQVLEAIPLGLVSVDCRLTVMACNACAESILGIEESNAIGCSLTGLDVSCATTALEQALTEARLNMSAVRVNDIPITHADGTEGFLGITVNPVRNTAGDDAGFLLVIADTTEQKILQGQLANAQKLESIGQLAAGIAHEINTPTQFVGDNIRFLQESAQDLIEVVDQYAGLLNPQSGPLSWEERSAHIRSAIDALDIEFLKVEVPRAIEQSLEGVERVANIVRSMKEFSHPGGQDLQAVDLNRAIESTITVARNEWKYVAEMVMNLDPALPPVPCLPGEFNQVILNMVINAAHAIADVVGTDGESKGTITVSTRQDGAWGEIRISDTGTGIREEHRARVFDHFFTTKDVGKGTGQGLAIAHSVITEKHGGSISLESEVGKGTTFIIRLPIERKSSREEITEHEEAHSLR